MIQPRSIVSIADNSGAKIGRIFKVLGSAKKRYAGLGEIVGCHCQNVYDGSDYDEDWEQATCKMCNNSNYDTNMIPRIALRESDQGVKPIVSAICVFEEGIQMSNVLAESLVDLCQYFSE